MIHMFFYNTTYFITCFTFHLFLVVLCINKVHYVYYSNTNEHNLVISQSVVVGGAVGVVVVKCVMRIESREDVRKYAHILVRAYKCSTGTYITHCHIVHCTGTGVLIRVHCSS